MQASQVTKGPDTAEKILDAAEDLFIEHGYAATSLRAIATRAGVNLAATNYHFGSKMGLLSAVFHRHIQPINEKRLLMLNALRKHDQSLTLRAILEALFTPLIQGITDTRIPALIGRIYSEPESITRPIIEKEFTEVAVQFQAALVKVLPHVSPEEIRWRFHFLVGSMIHLLKFQAPIGTEPSRAVFMQGIGRLIDYSIAGLEQHNVAASNA